jgi:hypothetical protein
MRRADHSDAWRRTFTSKCERAITATSASGSCASTKMREELSAIGMADAAADADGSGYAVGSSCMWCGRWQST